MLYEVITTLDAAIGPVAQASDVFQRVHAAGSDHRDSEGVGQLRRRFDRDALARAVAVDVGEHDACRAPVSYNFV